MPPARTESDDSSNLPFQRGGGLGLGWAGQEPGARERRVGPRGHGDWGPVRGQGARLERQGAPGPAMSGGVFQGSAYGDPEDTPGVNPLLCYLCHQVSWSSDRVSSILLCLYNRKIANL